MVKSKKPAGVPHRKRTPSPCADDNLDLERLRRWHTGIEILCEEYPERSEHDGAVMYPDRETRDVLLRVGSTHPAAVRQIYENLDYAEAMYKEFVAANDKNTALEFTSALSQLSQRVRTVLETLRKAEKALLRKPGGRPRKWNHLWELIKKHGATQGIGEDKAIAKEHNKLCAAKIKAGTCERIDAAKVARVRADYGKRSQKAK
jgi:hypothetical protein